MSAFRWPLLAALAASSISTLASATPRLDGQLGAPCSTNADCMGPEQWCWVTNLENEQYAPAQGLCSRGCADDSLCQAIDPGAVCVSGRCFEGCALDSPAGGEPDSPKCHGRENFACTQISPASGAVYARPFCTPLCTGDDACVRGSVCTNEGICADYRPPGGLPGDPCDRHNICRGMCFQACVEPCVLGPNNACPLTNDASPKGAACLDLVSGNDDGDLGGCRALCDCTSDCPAGMRCEAWDFEGRYAASGACAWGPPLTDAPDCLAAVSEATTSDCAYGPVRACKTETCLGTAECLAGAGYSECRCLESEAEEGGGSAGADESDAAAGLPSAAGGGAAAPSSSRQEPNDESGWGCRLAWGAEGTHLSWFVLSLALGAALRRRSFRCYPTGVAARLRAR